MPCMGPGINEAKFEQAYADIMELLKKRYQIQKYYPLQFNQYMLKRMMKLREECNTKLKAALREVFLQDTCENF